MSRSLGEFIPNVNKEFDGKVTLADAQHILFHILPSSTGYGPEKYPIEKPFGKFVGDLKGNVSLADAQHMLFHILPSSTGYGPERYPIGYSPATKVFTTEVDINNKFLFLKVNESSFPSNVQVSGIQLYIKGVLLQPRYEGNGGYITDSTLSTDWIVACNTIDSVNNISIIYLERNSNKTIEKSQDKVSLVSRNDSNVITNVTSITDSILCKFPFNKIVSSYSIDTSITVDNKQYKSMVVGVTPTEVTEFPNFF